MSQAGASRRASRGLWGVASIALMVGLSVALAFVAPLPDRLSVPGSTVVSWESGLPAHVFLAPDDRWRIPVAGDVDPAYERALIALEDGRFRWHPGVDPAAVVRATGQNIRAGRVVSGASTLTLQLVRLVEPRPRTLGSKVVEAARATQLELRWSKSQILAAYMDFVPFGRNVEGVQAGALALFGHGAARLTVAEIATLLAIPQDPAGRWPTPANAARLRGARDDIAERLLRAGVFELSPEQGVPDVLAEVRATAVPERLLPQPRSAPHAARWLRRQARLPPGHTVKTTLDAGLQAVAESVLAGHSAGLQNLGVDHAALVVVSHATGDVRALVGGFDFWADSDGAQMPAFTVPRSPGSTLKPLIYARAIGDGRSLPQFLVPDIPIRYGGYAPRNYDGDFDGLVRLEDALSRSLNVPFVGLLGEIGVEPFLGLLRSGGVQGLDPRPGHYGLSLAVGGVEITPLEMAGLYASLAAGGQVRVPRWRPDSGRPSSRSLLQPGAAWLTRRALRLRDRPDFPGRGQLSALPRQIHWKTGTSFGHRDAWAVGSGRRYTAVVWLGNLDQRPSLALVGASAAGPVLFDLLEALDDGLKGSVDAAPDDLMGVELCALSGRLPNAACPRRVAGRALAHAVPTELCALHVRVEVDPLTGRSVGPGCRPAGHATETTVAVRWPSTVRRWLAESWLAEPAVPAAADGCRVVASGAAPRVVSPVSGSVAMLLAGVPPDQQDVPLEADAAQGPLSWFVDGALVGQAPAGERVWWTPVPGTHEVLVMDPAGRSARVAFEVRGG